MFKSITYLNCTYDSGTQKYIYNYHLIDTDFECDISAPETPWAANAAETARPTVAAAAAVAEYHKRGLDVVRNIYLLNIFIQKEWYTYYIFMEILDWQNTYIDKYCPIDGINFSQEIYPKVKELYENLNNFS